MAKTVKEYIHKNSIDNVRLGKIIAKEGNICTIRIGTREITANFPAGTVGQTVSLQCPEGDDSKGYTIAVAPVILGDGGTEEI